MLAVASDLPTDDERYAFEMKWDGMRAILRIDGGSLTITSRTGNDVTGWFPELAPLAGALRGQGAVLDGEVVALDDHGVPSFEVLQPRLHTSPASVTARLASARPVVCMLFDVLWLAGRSCLDDSYEVRRSRLESCTLAGVTWQTPGRSLGDGAGALATAVELGLEGVVAKRRDSRYLPGRRSDAWRKVKQHAGQELVVGGWLPGQGRLEQRLGSLLVGYHEMGVPGLRYAGAVGSGIDERARVELEGRLTALRTPVGVFVDAPRLPGAVWVEPEIVVEVRFQQWTSGGVLRAPCDRGLRVDKPAADVTRDPGLGRASSGGGAPGNVS